MSGRIKSSFTDNKRIYISAAAIFPERCTQCEPYVIHIEVVQAARSFSTGPRYHAVSKHNNASPAACRIQLLFAFEQYTTYEWGLAYLMRKATIDLLDIHFADS